MKIIKNTKNKTNYKPLVSVFPAIPKLRSPNLPLSLRNWLRRLQVCEKFDLSGVFPDFRPAKSEYSGEFDMTFSFSDRNIEDLQRTIDRRHNLFDYTHKFRAFVTSSDMSETKKNENSFMLELCAQPSIFYFLFFIFL